jgi:hypothetical protein
VNDNLPEYPLYPDSEDIFNKSKKEDNIDPEDFSKEKNQTKDIKPGQILKENPTMMHLTIIWMFQVQSWTLSRKMSGMKMRRITITV